MLLRDKDRQQLVAIFAKAPLRFAVWAYGSRVNGDAHEASDLDLVIRTPDLTPLPAQLYASLCEQIRDSNIPILVQLHDWARLPGTFHERILDSNEVLFANN
ncbi:MAG: nucleotidyltransferase domain-containing protein [Chitinophagia bacterium]|nr:nucleotidyltransferase domain-containing protein [Chitinophagia bacterium]